MYSDTVLYFYYMGICFMITHKEYYYLKRSSMYNNYYIFKVTPKL